ncbi:uncharacterized protein LOC142979230 isoform X2 [Anticarsia gemmatalis]
MIEQSRAWKETWPDTDIGCAASHEKQKEKQREADLAKVAAFAKQKKNFDGAEVIKEARKKIFDNSCYGKKLLSAFHASKILEERDVQVKYLKELRLKQELESRQIKEECPFGLGKHGPEEEKLRKCKNLEIALQNKEISEKQKAEAAKAKEAQNQADLQNAKLMKELLDLEEQAEEKFRLLEKEALIQYSIENKKSKEERAKWDAEYYAKIEKCQKEKDEYNCKINHILREMTKREELPWAKKIYETIKLCQEQDRKRYDILIEKSIQLDENRHNNQEKESKEKEEQDLKRRYALAETNKQLAKYERQRRCTKVNKCCCDRQTLFSKSQRDRVKPESVPKKAEEKRPPNFGPSNKLRAALQKRMQEPSPWTGGKAAHEHFAREADKMLSECKYKVEGRKVVDEYMKNNGLHTLDVPNYR